MENRYIFLWNVVGKIVQSGNRPFIIRSFY